MTKSLSLLLLCTTAVLTGCRIPSPVGEQVPGYMVYVSSEVASRCGTVLWQDTAFTWASDNALSSGMIAWIPSNEGFRLARLVNRAVVLGAGSSMVEIARNTLPGPLHSTFTCQNTGEVLQADFTFPVGGPRASYLHMALNEQGLQGEWKLISLPI